MPLRVLPAATQQGSEQPCAGAAGRDPEVPSPGCHAVPGALPGGLGTGFRRGAGRSIPAAAIAQRGRRTERATFSTRPVCPPGPVRGPAWPAPDVPGDTQGGVSAGPARPCPRDSAPTLPVATPAVPGGGALVSPNRLSTSTSSGPSVPCDRRFHTSGFLCGDFYSCRCCPRVSVTAQPRGLWSVRATSKQLGTP